MPDDEPTGSTLDDLGPDLKALLERVASGNAIQLSGFESASLAYFDSHAFPDDLFNILAGITLPGVIAGTRNARLLDLGLAHAHRWEEAHSGHFLHKGSGYYFAGMRDILFGDLARGFLYMHQAFVEDQRSSGQENPATPALAFVTLDADKRDQAFYDQVAVYAAFLEARLRRYRRSRKGRLTLPALRQKRLSHPDLIEPLFQLVYVVARLVALERQEIGFARSNRFARGLYGRLASDLCLLIEDVVAIALPGEHRFIRTATAYAPNAGLALVRADFDDVHSAFGRDFQTTIRALLGGKYRTRAGKRMGLRESDLLIAYGIRNETAHAVSDEELLERRFEALESRLFFALFSAVETLYP